MSSETTLGGWLRQRRVETGVTQEELSNHLGFSLALLRKLESSERRPSGQIANLLAEYFRVPTDERDAFVAFARAAITCTADSASSGPVSISGDVQLQPAPWRRMYLQQTNLPTMLTPIIGREKEKLIALNQLLHPKVRLLTLTGTPGIGKTRLGLEVASALVEKFEDGVFFMDLAPIVNPDLVMATIARTLGLKEEGGYQLFERVLFDYLRERRILLFLDNFEQVLDAASLVVRLLEASPWLKVLITSREALHVMGERRMSVPPLALPDLQQLESLEVLAAYPAVELFIDRVQDVTPDFELTQENAADVAAICSGLEGVPLAIELAAARSRHFSPKELYSRLGSSLKLLTGGGRDFPARQRTLRSAIEWSYELLNGTEQRLLRYAGVFAGGFTAEAFEWLGEENYINSAVSTFDTLTGLTDKNLVRAERKTTKSEVVRFSLLEVIREYAVEQLQKQGEMEEARRGQASYYLALGEKAEQHFTGNQYPGWGADQLGWVERLEVELDNIRAALDWYLLQVEAKTPTQTETEADSLYLENLEKGLRLAIAVRRVWLGCGHYAEGVRWLTVFLSSVPRPVPVELPQLRASYAKAIAILARLTPLKGNVEAVQPLLEESLSIATELEDKQLMALILLNSGVVAYSQANYVTAVSFQRECLKLYRELNNKWGIGAVLQEHGNVEYNLGNFSLARSMWEESLQHFREVDETIGIQSVLIKLGVLAYIQGEYGEARALCQESIELLDKLGNINRADYPKEMLGWVALREGNYAEAKTLFKEVIQMGQEMNGVLTVYRGLVGLGAVAQTQHQAERAALYFGAAEGFGKARDIQLPALKTVELDLEIAAAREQLPIANWDIAWYSGHKLAVEITAQSIAGPFRRSNILGLLLAQNCDATTEET